MSSNFENINTIDVKISPIDGMRMVYVPEGEFLMGSTGFIDVNEDEKPQTRVYLDAFWIDQIPITNQMYVKFLNEKGNRESRMISWYNERSPYTRIKFIEGIYKVDDGYENHPIVTVTWSGADNYADWVGRKLPSEAQWEKAARGTDGRIYPWGNQTPSNKLLNHNMSVGDTTPVGSFPDGASPYGALDMAGNVWEYVADFYSADYYGTFMKNRNPFNNSIGRSWVIRGGSYILPDKNVRCAQRHSIKFDNNGLGGDIGFRCALQA